MFFRLLEGKVPAVAQVAATAGLFDRIGMQASYSSPEALEGYLAFKERRSPAWVHPDLRTGGRL